MTALLLTCIIPNISVDGHGPQGGLVGWLVALADAAARALLVAGIVWFGLRLLGVRNVVAQKAAWGLVLAGALVMPFAASWATRSAWLPAEATLVVPTQTWLHAAATAVLPQARKEVLRSDNPVKAPAKWSTAEPAQVDKVVAIPASSPADRFPAPAISNSYFAGAGNEPQSVTPAKKYFLPPSDLAWLVYATVGLALLLRLFYGLGAAVGLWQSAEPVHLEPSYRAAGLRLRSSRRVSSPVTVGSGIVLPADYDEWDAEKLRIVLAHERSHVRQGDFYLQALAGLYAALFWFSPLGWWLKRKLSDLSEAISDRAGLEEAVSHASYARILLEFAAVPRRTQIGVAMARTGRLSQRIERLLNENSFRQAFAGGRRRFMAVLLLVFGALFSATALIRVEAARILSQPVLAQGPATGQSHPENTTDGGPAIAPAKAPVAPVVTQAPAKVPAPASVAPTAPAGSKPAVAASAPVAPDEDADADQEAPEPPTSAQCTRSSSLYMYSRSSGHSSGTHGYGYAYSSNGESYAFVSGNERHMHFSGDMHTGEIDKARNMAHGDFLWFNRGGKSYVVDDPQTIGRIQAMYKPMEDLGRQQEELGKQQEALGRQQEDLGRKQEQASVPTPDIAREMADLNAAAASLQAKKNATITVDELADLQSKIGDLQGKLGELQGEMGTKQGEQGRQQGRLGEQQGRLGERQGRLGAEQGRLARDADVKIKSIIDESLKDGKARPVQ
jgi:beta-lactamase regulating signal transducer with metallopeptidase domain